MNQVRAIIGPGRSGTTWAGTIVDTCPEVIYRFEPFHRMSPVDERFHIWFNKLKAQSVVEGDIPRIYEHLRMADPLVNKEPFFDEKSYRIRKLGRRALWPVARAFPPANWLYRACYTPSAGPPVVFKEVTFVKPIRNLLEKTTVPVVYLVRHPCATVLSEIRGQGSERMPSRQRRLRNFLVEHAPSYLENFPEIVAGSEVVARTALLWRAEVEACMSVVRHSERGMVLTYEQLAGDAYRESERMLRHLGLEFGEATRRYLDDLHDTKAGPARSPRRTGWGKKYFSVYRNPREERNSWMSRITADERRRIESIVQGSPAVEQLAGLGGWW